MEADLPARWSCHADGSEGMRDFLVGKIADAHDAVKNAERRVADALNALQVDNESLVHERDGAFGQVREQKNQIEDLQILLNQAKAFIVQKGGWDGALWCKRVDAAIEGKSTIGTVKEDLQTPRSPAACPCPICLTEHLAKREVPDRKVEHCAGAHCGLYGQRACICLCTKCCDAKLRDR